MILSPFVSGVQTIAERFIQIAQYDKTVSAEILFQDSKTPTDYYVSTSGYARLKVHTLENDKTNYKQGDNVFISVPGGDFNSNDKIIVGKVRQTEKAYYLADLREILAVQDIDINNKRDNTESSITNEERFTTLVIEFEPKIKLYYHDEEIAFNDKRLDSLSPKLKLEEVVFPFELHFGKDEEEQKNNFKRSLWSSRNLYGNLFNAEMNVPHFQRIVFTNIQNLENPFVWWEPQRQFAKVVTFLDEPIFGLTAEITLENKKYYYGFTSEDLEKICLNDVSLHATKNGYFLFMRKGFFNSTLDLDKQQEWEPKVVQLKDLPRDYNWRIELYNESPVSQQGLSELLFQFNGKLTNEELNLVQILEELKKTDLIPHNYVPDNYILDKIETTYHKYNEEYDKYITEINSAIDENENNKLICLIAWPLWEVETNSNRQVVFDIIERKETQDGQ